jgi:hypothetical protein
MLMGVSEGTRREVLICSSYAILGSPLNTALTVSEDTSTFNSTAYTRYVFKLRSM